MAKGIIRSIDHEKGTVTISGEKDNGEFFDNSYEYSYVDSFKNKDGKSTTALNWIINSNDGTDQVKVNDVGVYWYEKNPDKSILKSFKQEDSKPKKSFGNYNKPKDTKDLAIMIAASLISAKGISDWQTFKETMVELIPIIEKDVENFRRL